MEEWAEHAVWWQVYPLGFTGAYGEPGTSGGAAVPSPPESADQEVAHRLKRLENWLDYAIELGASGLALGPVFASSTHGYDTIDHFVVDPRLGDEADLTSLFEAAHRRGLRILLDGVFNHVGRDHPAFRTVLEQGPSAPTADWFRLKWPQNWSSGVEPDYENFEGHDGLVALNHENPAVVDHVANVMNHWLDRGADGWRLDAAYAVPTEFWADVSARVREAHPQAYLIGEVIHGDFTEFVSKSGLDAVTQYELWKSIWSSFNDGNLFELEWTLRRHNELVDEFLPMTFVGNHDVTRLASRLTDVRHLGHALAVLLTVGGTPSIYAGDEQAFRGVKEDRIGGDDAVRPEFPDTPSDLDPEGWPTYRLHQELIGLRRRHAWLRRAQTRVVHLANGQLTYRSEAEGHALLVALNIADQEVEQPAPGATAVLAGTGTLDSRSGSVRLPAHSWVVLAV